MTITKTLVIVRHAHRYKQTDADNGLSPKGRRQTKRIRAFFKERQFRPRSVALLTSPKRRCRETIEPLAKLTGVPVGVVGLLDETRISAARIARFLRWWKAEGAELTIVCVHGNWVPEAVRQLIGAPVELAKGGWCEIQASSDGKSNELRWLVQDFGLTKRI